ncbi:MAG: hypothetical protein HUU33_14030 [Flavobacteriales bacterium]|nr:hypothetical protein [Flavobacteriales bacterium]
MSSVPLTTRIPIKDRNGHVIGEKEVATYAGLLARAHEEGLKCVRTELVQSPEPNNGRVAIVLATVETTRGTFTGIGDANPDNVNARIAPHLLRMAELEPRYRQARRAFEEGRWREAHAALEALLVDDPAYKDARLLRDAARTNASYTVTHVAVEEEGVAARATYAARVKGVPEALNTAIQEGLLALHDPFLVLVVNDHPDVLLAQQKHALEGIHDESTAARAGQLLGAQFVLATKLLRYEEGVGRHLEMQVNLMDASTGRIHRSELVHVAKQDLGRGASVRSLLIDKAAARAATLLRDFDPERP